MFLRTIKGSKAAADPLFSVEREDVDCCEYNDNENFDRPDVYRWLLRREEQ